jgi:ABC-type branched-subunit amino acid transport system ATPase component
MVLYNTYYKADIYITQLISQLRPEDTTVLYIEHRCSSVINMVLYNTYYKADNYITQLISQLRPEDTTVLYIEHRWSSVINMVLNNMVHVPYTVHREYVDVT